MHKSGKIFFNNSEKETKKNVDKVEEKERIFGIARNCP